MSAAVPTIPPASPYVPRSHPQGVSVRAIPCPIAGRGSKHNGGKQTFYRRWRTA